MDLGSASLGTIPRPRLVVVEVNPSSQPPDESYRPVALFFFTAYRSRPS
jgi:hypothetical protein